jgi:UDP-N-acetylmuramyl pentapeptide phosphotransferase/UDP-N-acetylglucosamine-1-phosphate transferase
MLPIFNSEFIVGCGSTFVACLLLLATQRWHGKLSLDSTEGVQKTHSVPTLRIGGIAIIAGLLSILFFTAHRSNNLLGPILVAALPAFVFGLAEDLTKKVGVGARLLATTLSGLLAWTLTGVSITHVEIWGLDLLLSFLPFSVLFTAFAIGGVANAFNIIDGFNGLASGTVLICLAAIGAMAHQVGDFELAGLCFVIGGVAAGFLIVNYPFGKIFLGDGGAYLLGFLTAWLAVLLAARNPSVSPWAPLLACGYPVFETMFSIARRFRARSNPGKPDSWHLHSLFKLTYGQRYFSSFSPAMRNSMVAPFGWAFAAGHALMAVRFFDSTASLAFASAGSWCIYCLIYRHLASLRRAELLFLVRAVDGTHRVGVEF